MIKAEKHQGMMRLFATATGLIFSSVVCLITSCSPAVKAEQVKATREKRIASENKHCEIHGAPMKRKLEIFVDFYPFDLTSPFQKKRRLLFFNDGTTFSSCCGYHPAEMTWVCPECSTISVQERKRRGISE